ncbi:MAG: small ribosomal subunit Rsm22 family protein [bacterium]|nr:small ribosomal subunit Rsm22 family protein [bacterium]
MHLDFPKYLAELIEDQLLSTSIEKLVKAFKDTHLLYEGKSLENKRQLTGLEKLCYLAIRMPATFSADCRVFETLKNQYPEFAPNTLLDLGAGPATASLAARQYFDSLKSTVCIERDKDFLDFGKSFLDATNFKSELLVQDIKNINLKSNIDLVIASYSLGELNKAELSQTLQKAWQLTNSTLIIIEPGTPRGFEVIKNCRDDLIKLNAQIIAPCHHMKPCPMSEPKWCHFKVRFNRSKLHRMIKDGDLGYEDENFSYLIASKNLKPNFNSGRIVSYPKKEKGLINFEICSNEGQIKKTRILKRDKLNYAQCDSLTWGDSLPKLT